MSNETISPDSLGFLLHIIRSGGAITISDNTALYSEEEVRNDIRDPFLILDGELEYNVINGVYATPFGLIPRVRDVMKLGNLPQRTVIDRAKNPNVKYASWYKIAKPTPAELKEAIANVNNLYIRHFSKQDHCEICNALDDVLFKEDCWLVDTRHECGKEDVDIVDVTFGFTYAYGGIDYKVNIDEWLEGFSPHIIKEQ